MNSHPDYTTYSIDELLEALEGIDKKNFPDRVKRINMELTARSVALTKSASASRERLNESESKYVPNEVPIWEQIKNLFLSVSVIIFGSIGVIENDLPVTLCRRCEDVYHLTGTAAWVMYGALLLMAASFISEVVDHYDKRDNEHIYHRISNLTSLPGLGLFALAMYIHI